MDLNLLRCFKVVAENESITEASKTLHLSQPAISLQIKRLEEQIGKQLFDRHNRGLSLTPFGITVLAHSKRLFDVESELQALINGKSEEPQGRVRIGTYTTASSYLLSKPLTELLKNNRKVSVSYAYATCEEIIEKIKNYSLECGVFSEVPPDDHLEITPIFTDKLIFAQSAKIPLVKTDKIVPADLSHIDFLSYPLRYDLCYRSVEQRFGRHLAKTRVVAESENFETLKQMLIQGAGATFIPRYLIESELKKGLIKEIEIQKVNLPITFSFVTKRNAELSAATELIRRMLLNWFHVN